jgi:hypothetical protein
MDTVDKIKKLIFDGYVLDDQGAWVPLSERLETEKKIVERLSSGKVLCNGHWVPIRKAQEACVPEDVPVTEDTKSLNKRRAPRSA